MQDDQVTLAAADRLHLDVTPEEFTIITPRLQRSPIHDLAQAGLILLSDEERDLIESVYPGAEEIFVEEAIRNYVADLRDAAALRRAMEHRP